MLVVRDQANWVARCHMLHCLATARKSSIGVSEVHYPRTSIARPKSCVECFPSTPHTVVHVGTCDTRLPCRRVRPPTTRPYYEDSSASSGSANSAKSGSGKGQQWRRPPPRQRRRVCAKMQVRTGLQPPSSAAPELVGKFEATTRPNARISLGTRTKIANFNVEEGAARNKLRQHI